MSRYNEIVEKLKAIGFTKGKTTLHFVYWICPCPTHEHVVPLVANHPSEKLITRLLVLINKERKTKGLSPFIPNKTSFF